MAIKVKEKIVGDVLEQMGRIPMVGVAMWGVIMMEIQEPAKALAMLSLLIWMILPTFNMFKMNEEKKN